MIPSPVDFEPEAISHDEALRGPMMMNKSLPPQESIDADTHPHVEILCIFLVQNVPKFEFG